MLKTVCQQLPPPLRDMTVLKVRIIWCNPCRFLCTNAHRLIRESFRDDSMWPK